MRDVLGMCAEWLTGMLILGCTIIATVVIVLGLFRAMILMCQWVWFK